MDDERSNSCRERLGGGATSYHQPQTAETINKYVFPPLQGWRRKHDIFVRQLW